MLQYLIRTSVPLADVAKILDTGKLSGAEQLLMNPAALTGHRVDQLTYVDLHDGREWPGKWVSMTNALNTYVHSFPQRNVSIPNSAKAAAFVINASSELPESGT